MRLPNALACYREKIVMALSRVLRRVTFLALLAAPPMSVAQLPSFVLDVALVPAALAPAPVSSPLALALPHPIGTASFAVATTHAGVSGNVMVSVDTGRVPLPLTAGICQTDPSTGACLAPPAASLSLALAAGQAPTFAVSVDALASLPLDRDFHRVHVRFTDTSGASVGGASVAVHNTTYGRAFPIMSGGTYSGAWTNDDFVTGAPGASNSITYIQTTDPVLIENCYMRSSQGFVGMIPGANVTIRNCRIYGVEPGVAGAERGYAVFTRGIGSLTMEHNYLEGVAWGAAVWSTDTGAGGRSTATGPIVVRYNKVRNLDGLASDGQGGRVTHANPNANHNGFVSFMYMDLPHGAEIAWNEITNEPGLSATADMFSLLSTRGTAVAPIRLYDNFVWGQYAPIPERGNGIDPRDCPSASPACYNTYVAQVMSMDGNPSIDTAQTATAYVRIHGNQLVNTWGGIALSTGHDNEAWGNRVVSTGRLRNGNWMAAAYNAGVIVFDGYGAGPGVYFNNSAHDNIVGFVLERVSQADPSIYLAPPIRSDYAFEGRRSPLCGASLCFNNHSLPDPITFETEDNEAMLWRSKLADNKITVGPLLPADCLFNWAESRYGTLLQPAGAATRASPPYLYRHYADSRTYIGLSVTDNHLYYLGPASESRVLDLGDASAWLQAAGCR